MGYAPPLRKLAQCRSDIRRIPRGVLRVATRHESSQPSCRDNPESTSNCRTLNGLVRPRRRDALILVSVFGNQSDPDRRRNQPQHFVAPSLPDRLNRRPCIRVRDCLDRTTQSGSPRRSSSAAYPGPARTHAGRRGGKRHFTAPFLASHRVSRASRRLIAGATEQIGCCASNAAPGRTGDRAPGPRRGACQPEACRALRHPRAAASAYNFRRDYVILARRARRRGLRLHRNAAAIAIVRIMSSMPLATESMRPVFAGNRRGLVAPRQTPLPSMLIRPETTAQPLTLNSLPCQKVNDSERASSRLRRMPRPRARLSDLLAGEVEGGFFGPFHFGTPRPGSNGGHSTAGARVCSPFRRAAPFRPAAAVASQSRPSRCSTRSLDAD